MAVNHWYGRLEQMALVFFLALWASLGFSAALTEVFLWTSFGFFALHLCVSRSKPLLPDKISLILLLLFFGMVAVSMFVSEYPKQSFRGFFKLTKHFVIFILAINLLRTEQSQEKWRLTFFFVFLVLSINAFVQYFKGVDVLRGFYAQPSNSGWRIGGSFETYGKFAAYLCVAAPIAIFAAAQSWKIPKLRSELLVWLPLSLAGIFLLFATRSRGGVLAFFLGMVVLLIFRRSWKILGVLILAAAVLVSLLPKSMVVHLDADHKEQSLVERFELWNRAWDVIRAKPWTGTGINTYAVAHQKFDTRKNWRVQNYYAHNGYLQMGAEIGLPGLFLFIGFLGRWIWIHRPRYADIRTSSELPWGFFGGALAFMIFCLADTALHSPQPVMTFWYAVGLLGAFSPRLRKTT